MNKYRRGKILTFLELIEELRKNRYVYLDKRPTHWGWLREMSFNVLLGLTRYGRFYKAINNIKEEKS